MQTETAQELCLFVRDPTTGRIVFNAKAIQALGLSPAEVAERGYPLDDQIASPATVPNDGPLNDSANG